MKTMSRVFGTMLALTLAVPAVGASEERVGVATTVVGPVTIARVATPPAPLKFKDDLFLNDRVATGDKGFARMLLGGKAIVTARENSVITITEAPGVSTVDLVSGRISVAVDKSKMRPGEVVEIKTPNAVAGIRGTIVIAETVGNASVITVLRGLVDVYRRDPLSGNPIGPATPVGVRESVTVRANVLPARPQPVTVEKAHRLSNDFTPPVQPVSAGSTLPVAEEVTRAKDVLGTLTNGNSGRSDGTAARLDKVSAKVDRGEGIGNGNGQGNGAPTAAAPTPTTPILAPAPLPATPIVTVNPRADIVQQQKVLKDLLKKN